MKFPNAPLEAMIKLELLHWGRVMPEAVFLIQREGDSPDLNEELQRQVVESYRELAERERLCSRVVTLQNDSSIEDALDEVWEVIAPIRRRFTQRRAFSKDAEPEDQLTFPWAGFPQIVGGARLRPAQPTIVYDTYWRFAVARQELFFLRVKGCMPPWTQDPILAPL